MLVQSQSRLEEPRSRRRQTETPAARHARRLRHLARMREWYARQATSSAVATHTE